MYVLFGPYITKPSEIWYHFIALYPYFSPSTAKLPEIANKNWQTQSIKNQNFYFIRRNLNNSLFSKKFPSFHIWKKRCGESLKGLVAEQSRVSRFCILIWRKSILLMGGSGRSYLLCGLRESFIVNDVENLLFPRNKGVFSSFCSRFTRNEKLEEILRRLCSSLFLSFFRQN